MGCGKIKRKNILWEFCQHSLFLEFNFISSLNFVKISIPKIKIAVFCWIIKKKSFRSKPQKVFLLGDLNQKILYFQARKKFLLLNWGVLMNLERPLTYFSTRSNTTNSRQWEERIERIMKRGNSKTTFCQTGCFLAN